jgi:hypothetical protein
MGALTGWARNVSVSEGFESSFGHLLSCLRFCLLFLRPSCQIYIYIYIYTHNVYYIECTYKHIKSINNPAVVMLV